MVKQWHLAHTSHTPSGNLHTPSTGLGSQIGEAVFLGPLGKKSAYVNTYSPQLLCPVARALARNALGFRDPLPFAGLDIWNGFELSWLNPKGKPEIALVEICFPCSSPYLIESKSLKLYLNSFNQSPFASMKQVERIIEEDLRQASEEEATSVRLLPLCTSHLPLEPFAGTCLDGLDIATNSYCVEPRFLVTTAEPAPVNEAVYSHLFKSNCLATGQPDWGSLFIHYAGKKIAHEGLLKYLISFRNHSGFAEHCVEQIFFDVSSRCLPDKLTVYARYTRRGGLDINPFRSNWEKNPLNKRQIRQ